MKTLSLSILAFFTFIASLHAQTAIPPDTVFPLGGLTSYLNGDNVHELPLFGLNFLYNAGHPYGPGQGAVQNNMSGSLAGCLMPGGTYYLGYNPYFFQTDIDLVSNESGDAAWDLNNQWNIPTWNAWMTYSTQNNNFSAVLDQNGNEWICTVDNGTSFNQQPGTTAGNASWVQPQGGQWMPSTNYAAGDQVSEGAPLRFWTCLQLNSGNTPQTNSTFWQLGTEWNSAISYLSGDQVTFTGAPGATFVCNKDNPSTGPATSTSATGPEWWFGTGFKGQWVSGTTYVKGDQVTQNGLFYTCVIGNPGTTSPPTSDWQSGLDWASINYKTGDQVTFQGATYTYTRNQDESSPQQPPGNDWWPGTNSQIPLIITLVI